MIKNGKGLTPIIAPMRILDGAIPSVIHIVFLKQKLMDIIKLN